MVIFLEQKIMSSPFLLTGGTSWGGFVIGSEARISWLVGSVDWELTGFAGVNTDNLAVAVWTLNWFTAISIQTSSLYTEAVGLLNVLVSRAPVKKIIKGQT